MIGVLNAYHFDSTPGTYQEKYEPLMRQYLSRVLPGESIKTYKVAQGEFSKDHKECRGWVITGSPASVYDDEFWVKNLISWVQEAHQKKVKLLGICFGHQLIAEALGGKVNKSSKGWGVGVRAFQMIQQTSIMTPRLETCSLLFSHQDQVTKLPEGAVHLATDSFCEFQMFSVGDHIFSMQGHPEFTREFAQERYEVRKEVIGVEKYHNALDSMQWNTDEDVVGQWVRGFFNGIE